MKIKNLMKISNLFEFNAEQKKIMKVQQYKILNNIIKYLNI